MLPSIVSSCQRKCDGSLASRLCWQRKKSGKPRPIKMGELLRSSYAKRTLAKHGKKLRPTLRSMHQWGIGIPGSVEAMVHWRGTVEELVKDGHLQPMVAIDVDLVNMFGNAEWPQIREAINEFFADISPWTEWRHERHAVTVLPSGAVHATDRGAEQGDGFGSVQSGLVLGKARAQHWAADARGASAEGTCDQWFIDDGQAFVLPDLVDAWLRALDKGVATFGGTRGKIADGNAKSSARLLCPPSRRQEFGGWDKPYVRMSVEVIDSDGPNKALGAPFGGLDHLHAVVKDAVDKTANSRAAIVNIDHAATELVLTRQCADVAKLTYHMRINGDRISPSLLAAFDGDLRVAIETILGGDLPDHSWWQAALGVCKGGLGLRQAQQVALAAFVASRVSSRPQVQDMAKDMELAKLASASTIVQAYDRRTEDALVSLVATLPPEAGQELIDKLIHAADVARDVYDGLFEGVDAAVSEELSPRAGRRSMGARLLPANGEGDGEHPDAAGQGRTHRIQNLIMRYVDDCSHGTLQGTLVSSGDGPSMRRIRELSDKDVDHTWLWRLNRQHGPILPDAEFVEALRLRLGTAGPADPVPCALCGAELLDSAGAHAMCCGQAESTRGHYAVSKQVYTAAQQCDPAAELEAPDLIPGTALRPADVLTTAVGTGALALDIGIASPDAQTAGDDCTVAMYERKVAYYAPHQASLERQNISYQPLVWSAFGRPHPRTTTILRTLSKRIARRRGCSDAAAVYKSLHGAVSLEIWRRAARQAMSCWPVPAEWLVQITDEHAADENT